MNEERVIISAMAMQGLLAGGADKSNSFAFIAQRAVKYADALLNELYKVKDDATDID